MGEKLWVAGMVPGKSVKSCLLVKQKSLISYREKPGQYLNLLLADRTGEIEGRVWDEALWQAVRFQAGDVLQIEGTVVEYNGQFQIRIDSLRRAEEGFSWDELLPTSPRDRNEMLAQLEESIAGVDNPHLRALLESFFRDPDFYAGFTVAPAAKKVHHAYRGGLLEHTLNVVTLAGQLAILYPQVDRDLLVTGALLHDIGKVEELRGEPVPDYTVAGRLLGHIVLGVQMLTRRIASLPDFPAGLALKVMHMVVSHHGEYQWQSPKRPKFLEAVLLHRSDLMDAEAGHFRSLKGRGMVWDKTLNRYLYLEVGGRGSEVGRSAGPRLSG